MIKNLYGLIVWMKKKEIILWPFFYKINKLLVNLLYPIIARFSKRNGLDETSEIIVSLTSFPDRINTVWITISTLLNQTLKPKKIILWLAENEFPTHQVPKSLERMKKRGLEIRFCDDLKPHKKYFFAMNEFPENIIVTADDDIFYPENNLEKLENEYKKNKNSVICHWSHKIGFDQRGDFLPYNDWKTNDKELSCLCTIPIGCNSVLYPPGCLYYDALSKCKVLKYVYTDDLWLKCMEIMNGTPARNCNETPLIYFNIITTQFTGLWKNNTENLNRNDTAWKQLMKDYPEVRKRLYAEYMEQL